MPFQVIEFPQTKSRLHPWQKAVVEEYEEMGAKTRKLIQFTYSLGFESLPLDERNRIVKQKEIMNQYATILRERIEHFIPRL
jgi:hypothetical protein